MGCEAQRERPANGTPTMTRIVLFLSAAQYPWVYDQWKWMEAEGQFKQRKKEIIEN